MSNQEDAAQSGNNNQRFQMLRDYTLADVFTLGNAAAGTVSIFLCLNYLAEDEKDFLWMAFLLLPISAVLDALDGWVARKRQSTGILGADLDSLADIVSFGVAPAVLAFTLGMRGFWDVVILAYFVCCGISRLARYNVTSEYMSDDSGKVAYFEGTPIPTSLILVLMLGVAFGVDAIDDRLWGGQFIVAGFRFHPLTLLFGLSGSLMISTLKVPKP